MKQISRRVSGQKPSIYIILRYSGYPVQQQQRQVDIYNLQKLTQSIQYIRGKWIYIFLRYSVQQHYRQVDIYSPKILRVSSILEVGGYSPMILMVFSIFEVGGYIYNPNFLRYSGYLVYQRQVDHWIYIIPGYSLRVSSILEVDGYSPRILGVSSILEVVDIVLGYSWYPVYLRQVDIYIILTS